MPRRTRINRHATRAVAEGRASLGPDLSRALQRKLTYAASELPCVDPIIFAEKVAMDAALLLLMLEAAHAELVSTSA